MNSRIASNDLEFVICEIKARLLKGKIIRKYKDSSDDDLRIIADYLSHNAISAFPYEFTNDYRIEDFPVIKDPDCGLFFLERGGRRIYLRTGYKSAFRASRYIKNLFMEQDIRSPHCYTEGGFLPEEGSILLDVGGAEGIFTFEHIDKVKHAYIFECDQRWIDALKQTFKDQMDKITIVEKYVTGFTDNEHITIDDFVKLNGLENEKIFIKADIEGDEINLIDGASHLINSNANLKFAICSYHFQEHEQIITERFSGWNIIPTKGYMLYYYDFGFTDPYVRKGVLRISRG